MFVEEYWKLVIGTTLGVCLLIFGAVFWESATEDVYNPVSEKTNKVETCSDYMEYPMYSIGDRDECLQKRQIGGSFIGAGTLVLWGSLYLNKNYLSTLFEKYF